MKTEFPITIHDLLRLGDFSQEERRRLMEECGKVIHLKRLIEERDMFFTQPKKGWFG